MLVNCTVAPFLGFITFRRSRKRKNGHPTLAASLYIFAAASFEATPELLIALHLELLIRGSKLRGEMVGGRRGGCALRWRWLACGHRAI